jgi:hypothetical protein
MSESGAALWSAVRDALRFQRGGRRSSPFRETFLYPLPSPNNASGFWNDCSPEALFTIFRLP